MKTTPQETERKQDKQNAQNSGAGAIFVQYQNPTNVRFVVSVETERRLGMTEDKDILKLEYTDWTGKIKTTLSINLKGCEVEDDYIRNKVEQFLTFIGVEEVD